MNKETLEDLGSMLHVVDGLKEVKEELLSRERDTSSSSSVYKEFILGLEVLGDKDYLDGECLSDGFKRVYGFHIENNYIPQEIKMLSNNKEIFHLISSMKVYHTNGLSLEFDINKMTLRKIQGILIRRRLLASLKWTGRARGTFGMILYLTKDCTRQNIEDYMRQYIDIDSLREDYEKKNPKKTTKTNKEVVDSSMERSRLFKDAKGVPSEDDGSIFVPNCIHDRSPDDRCTKSNCRSRKE